MLITWFIGGCVGDPKSIDSVGGIDESAPTETADSEVSDDTETGRPDETDGDTAETGGATPLPAWTREPMDPDWRGGDPVPGWEDRDCPYLYGPDVMHLDYRTPAWAIIVMGANAGGTPRFLTFVYKQDDVVPRSGRADAVFNMGLDLGAFADPDGEPVGDRRGTGWFGPAGTSQRYTALATLYTPFDVLIPEWEHHGGPATCVRYVGPDRITASTYLAPFPPPGRRDGRSPYDTVTWELDFEHIYAEHAAQSEYYPTPADFAYISVDVVYAEGAPYVDAWPWAEITDPGIRAAMFWRYMPPGDPYYHEALRRTGVRP